MLRTRNATRRRQVCSFPLRGPLVEAAIDASVLFVVPPGLARDSGVLGKVFKADHERRAVASLGERPRRG